MTMKLNHNGENVPPLDLSDEDTLTQLLNTDVLKPQVDKETQATEAAIKELKPAKITLTLSGAENAQLTRMAEIKGCSIKEFILSTIHEQLLDSNVAKPLISAPSSLSGVATRGRKITAPTGLARRSS